MKARNGRTDLYGLLFRPTTFDPSKKYPIVNRVYPGPQSGSVGSRQFSAARGDAQAIAELGFVVVSIDAMGTPMRSKEFHTAYYANMGDDGITLNIRRGERWCVMGRNGAGKSTLLKMIAGQVAPDAGHVRLGASLQMGYFAQQSLDLLRADLTIEEQLRRDFPDESIGALRTLAGAFQFSGDDIDKKIRALSGGEKTRLVLARMLLNPPNFLVLDEPTNHLDLATKEMLLDSLQQYDGTMLFVSHDRAFLRGLSNRVLELGGESGTETQPHAYPGSYVEYVERTGHEAPGVHR